MPQSILIFKDDVIVPGPGDDIFGDDDYVEDATDVGDGDVEDDVDGDDNLAE